MAQIKPVEAIAAKWARVTPQRVDDFQQGVQSPRRDWATAASAANDTYKTAVTAAANAGRFATGVTKAGSAKWSSKTLSKGPSRFAQGVAEAGPDYAQGFAPYAQTIAGTTLPPRFAKGDPRNIERVTAIAKALNMRRIGSAR